MRTRTRTRVNKDMAGAVLGMALGVAALGEWEPGRECTNYNSRDYSISGCDGWPGVDAAACLNLCQNSTLPAGCPQPEEYECEYAVWSESPTYNGWCQTSNSSCAPIESAPTTQLYPVPRSPVNDTCDLPHYNECADTLQQHGKDCSQAGGGQPEDVRRCLDFFFGGENVTEYCCPCVLFYAQKYSLPALAPACASDRPGPGPSPPPPPSPPWGPCTSMAGQWQDIEHGAGANDTISVVQDAGACNWQGTGSPGHEAGWTTAVAVWASQWDLILTFEYPTQNTSFSGHLGGCDPERCPPGSTISFASSGGMHSGRWRKL